MLHLDSRRGGEQSGGDYLLDCNSPFLPPFSQAGGHYHDGSTGATTTTLLTAKDSSRPFTGRPCHGITIIIIIIIIIIISHSIRIVPTQAVCPSAVPFSTSVSVGGCHYMASLR